MVRKIFDFMENVQGKTSLKVTPERTFCQGLTEPCIPYHVWDSWFYMMPDEQRAKFFSILGHWLVEEHDSLFLQRLIALGLLSTMSISEWTEPSGVKEINPRPLVLLQIIRNWSITCLVLWIGWILLLMLLMIVSNVKGNILQKYVIACVCIVHSTRGFHDDM